MEIKEKLLIVGCGKLGKKISNLLSKKFEIIGVKRKKTNTDSHFHIIELDIFNTNNLKYSDKSVNVFLDVEKSTESILNLPVSIINIPTDVNINYYPKSIKVSFTVSLDNFQKYSSKDFKIICDFNEISQDGKLTAEVLNQPKLIKNLRLINNEIQYVILKW